MSQQRVTQLLTCPYDTALPQPWVNQLQRAGFDPRGCVVWGYPQGFAFGFPIPLSPISAHKLAARETGVDVLFKIWEEVGVPMEKYFPLLQRIDKHNQIC